ncbi:MAG: hypothetical protein KIT84_37220 [Labilithrix sp.]|nr:hypothetical protein [Labilithrix sp.]MCW5816700.1 hypothetical protein [Labilithrix sp.]
MIPTSPLKRLPLADPGDPVLEIDESIELFAEDLLDIDGSDDQTIAAPRGLARKLMPPKRKTRSAAAYVPPPPPSEPEDNRVTQPFGLEKHVPRPIPAAVRTSRMPSMPSYTPSSAAPAHFAFAAAPPRNPRVEPRDAGSTFEPVASFVGPAHFANVRERKASSSFPPIALAGRAARDSIAFIQDRPSRAGWIAAAVAAVLLLVAGSMRVQSVVAPAPVAAAEPFPPPPVVVVAAPAAPAPAAPAADAKVVTFGDDQGVAIKPAAAAKPAAAPVKHAAPRPTPKPASTLSLSDSKPKSDKGEKSGDKLSAAEKKKISDELAEAQLRAASR